MKLSPDEVVSRDGVDLRQGRTNNLIAGVSTFLIYFLKWSTVCINLQYSPVSFLSWQDLIGFKGKVRAYVTWSDSKHIIMLMGHIWVPCRFFCHIHCTQLLPPFCHFSLLSPSVSEDLPGVSLYPTCIHALKASHCALVCETLHKLHNSHRTSCNTTMGWSVNGKSLWMMCCKELIFGQLSQELVALLFCLARTVSVLIGHL